jgi:hypothetical protein
MRSRNARLTFAPLLQLLALTGSASALQFAACGRSSVVRSLRCHSPLLQALDSDDKPASSDEVAAEEEEPSGKVDAWGRPVAESKFKLDFDFGGGGAKPASARGKDGLDDQGFEPYSLEEASKPADSTYLILLGGFALVSAALSVTNVVGS